MQERLPDVASPVESLSVNALVGLRISWGGGEVARWKIEVESSTGPVKKILPLGLAADTPGSMFLDQGVAVIEQPSAGVYNGIELHVENQVECNLTITMVDADQPAIQFQKTIALAELLPGKAIGVPVDDRQNRLNIARSPGDSLKVNFEREHLVFWQGEEFTVDVQPHLTNLKNRSARCKVSICLLYTSPSPRDRTRSRMPSSA